MPSVKAENRPLDEWFDLIRTGKVSLPRFQRREAWGESEIVALLNTILQGLPAGAALTLLVGDKEPFPGRPIVTAPALANTVSEQLLDGQQRLTALWRSLKDSYPDRTFFIEFEREANGSPKFETAAAFDEARYEKKGERYPRWADNSAKCWQEKAAIPVRLLDPDDEHSYGNWVREAVANIADPQWLALYDAIGKLRKMFASFNLPYLALPKTTEPRVALDVFVKMNTSFVKLSNFDISVAYVEAMAGQSLHDQLADLEAKLPAIKRFDFLQNLVLDVAAHRCGVTPGPAGYKRIDWKRIANEWDVLVEGVKYVLELLEQERIFDATRLPSYSPLPVIAALWEHRGLADTEGRARTVFKRYLWHAFLTDRYQKSSVSNAATDARALRAVFTEHSTLNEVPIFNSANHPLVSEESIITASWPREKNILARALLTLQLQCNALDFADNSAASAGNIGKREYHHLFPVSLLESCGLNDDQIWRAANCALITWRTNRKIGDQDPLVYLQRRTESAFNGEADVIARLRTHLVYFPDLQVGTDASLLGGERATRIQADYERFCRSRAGLLHTAATQAAAGNSVNADSVFNAWELKRSVSNSSEVAV